MKSLLSNSTISMVASRISRSLFGRDAGIFSSDGKNLSEKAIGLLRISAKVSSRLVSTFQYRFGNDIVPRGPRKQFLPKAIVFVISVGVPMLIATAVGPDIVETRKRDRESNKASNFVLSTVPRHRSTKSVNSGNGVIPLVPNLTT